ncbi:MAG: alcohol dehydrogenase, propanol-preferring [Pseudonocardiales bacterium]|nr:alcohol dehydrogenase, propanol-preferring [Pseudonocardiales bacterium]
MTTMTAYRLVQWQAAAQFREVPVPVPGAGEVLVRTDAVGLCHSDLLLQDAPTGAWPFAPPFTLGHEVAGTVAALGPPVSSQSSSVLDEGDAVLLSCVHSCGLCDRCVRGQENYCALSLRFTTRGVGLDGGLAEYVVAPAREAVRLRSLTPRQAAVLSDAGATAYHAVRCSLAKLPPGSTALVIGAGGLGGFAIQHLRLLSRVRVIAVDTAVHRLEFARELGADELLTSDDSTAARIRELTGGEGCAAVFDFVGTDDTLALSLASAAAAGRITVCGAAGGQVAAGWGRLPGGCELVISYGHTLSDIRDVVALAEQGAFRIETEDFPFAQVAEAYERLRSGALSSRALITMH